MLLNRNDLEMQQGSTFQLQLLIQDANTNPIDMTYYSALMSIKTDYVNTVLAESLSTANSEIVMGSNTGILNLMLPANRTANVYVDLSKGFPPKTNYVYDVSLTSNTGITTKIMYGNIAFYGQV